MNEFAILDAPERKQERVDNLPPPDIVESLPHEVIGQEMIQRFKTLYPEYTGLIASDPALKLIEVFAFREAKLRERVNEACRQIMLTYARGTNLDHIAAIFGLARVRIPSGDTQLPDRVESDERLRMRTHMTMETLSPAGPHAAYRAHALYAHLDVQDAYAQSPEPGVVEVSVLSKQNQGIPSEELLEKVRLALNDERVRPLTDFVTVKAAGVVSFKVEAVIYFKDDVVLDKNMLTAKQGVTDYITHQYQLGQPIRRSKLFFLMTGGGAHHVDLKQPASDIIVDADTAAFCESIDIQAYQPDAVFP
jgi:phage-related baseplate assembly protein